MLHWYPIIDARGDGFYVWFFFAWEVVLVYTNESAKRPEEMLDAAV
jgi:hypothetical protein